MMYKGVKLSNIIDKEPTLKFKLPNYVSEKTLGNFTPKLNLITFEQEYEIIIDIEKILKYCIELNKFGWKMSFEQVFSHVISHEYLHYLLLTQIGKYENECFDNLFGKVSYIPDYVFSGIKFEGDLPYLYILPKRHIYTKLINTIKNKVTTMKKWIDNKIDKFFTWLFIDCFPFHLIQFPFICLGLLTVGLIIIILVG